jgi:hypothetical protein
MKITIALWLLLAASPLFAQYGPPAKDLDEAQFFMREIQRQLEPAVTEARDRAAVFSAVTRAHNKLIGKEPAAEVSDAIKVIDDFLYRRKQSGKELSRENLKTLDSVRKELELAQPPYAIPVLYERLHHAFVHNLERQVLKDMADIERLRGEWDSFALRLLKPTYNEGIAGVTAAAKEPGQ